MNIKFTCEFISRSVAKINGVVDHLQARMHIFNFFSILTREAVVSIDNTVGEGKSVLEVDE